MEPNERTQDRNGDGAGTGIGVETRGRTQDRNGDGKAHPPPPPLTFGFHEMQYLFTTIRTKGCFTMNIINSIYIW